MQSDRMSLKVPADTECEMLDSKVFDVVPESKYGGTWSGAESLKKNMLLHFSEISLNFIEMALFCSLHLK